MNTRNSTGIRAICATVVMLVVIACTAASCGPEKPVGHVVASHCAFGDPKFVISLGVCEAVAEYYVAHHEWPLSRSQLEKQWDEMLAEAIRQTPGENPDEDGPTFFHRFTSLEFRKNGENLWLHFSFDFDGNTVDHQLNFAPGATADDIVRNATDASGRQTDEE